MRKVWYNGNSGSQGTKGRRRHAQRVFHIVFHTLWKLWKTYPQNLWKTSSLWKTLWKLWKSFPQKLWKSGGVENFGENSVENPLKFSTIIVESFVEKSFPQLPVENFVD